MKDERMFARPTAQADSAITLGQHVLRWALLLPKPFLFGMLGALGCLLGGVVGEALLSFTRKAPPPALPCEICLLMDCSGSMAGEKINEVKEAAIHFLKGQDLSRDTVSVVGFNTFPWVASSLTNRADVLVRAVNELQASGSTRMDLGMETAIEQFSRRSSGPEGPARAILMFTDGMPEPPSASAPTLRLAQSARADGILIVSVATGDAEVQYLEQVTGDPKQVVPTSSGRFLEAFRQAERVIRSKQLVESANQSSQYSAPAAMARIGAWTALLSLGLGLVLILAQNRYLHRQLLSLREGLLGAGGSIGAGLVAGALGQLLFQSAASLAALELVGRIAAWSLLGALLGLGMTFFVPNLKTWRALLGGAIGGLVGSLGFLAGAGVVADVAGRLLGAGLLGFFIGLMIALAERLVREACLLVHWGPKETTTVNLGARTIILGSSPEAHIYLPKEKGFPPVTGLVSFNGGKVE
ncbi:MAG: VWA domain-containing protein, partial [Verrucomicrobia bacterium]|nr:VWA domain-containing protein [Verrucomicrobiota bacterium]